MGATSRLPLPVRSVIEAVAVRMVQVVLQRLRLTYRGENAELARCLTDRAAPPGSLHRIDDDLVNGKAWRRPDSPQTIGVEEHARENRASKYVAPAIEQNRQP